MSFKRRRRKQRETRMAKVDRKYMKAAIESRAEKLEDEAYEKGYDLDEYLVEKFPADPESKDQRDAITYALEECYDINLQGHHSNRLNEFDMFAEETDDIPTQLLNMYYDRIFSDKLVSHRASVAGLTTGRPFVATTEGAVQNQIDYGPSFAWQDLAANVERIPGDSYFLPLENNSPNERIWEIIPETGGEPAAMVLGYSEKTAIFETYRKKLTASYDFLRNNQTRIATFRNAVLQLTGGLAEAFQQKFAKVIHDGVPSGNLITLSGNDAMGNAHAAGVITLAEWKEVQQAFGSVYKPTRIICNQTAWRAIDFMAAQSSRQFVLRDEARRQDSNLVPEFYSLNSSALSVGYGWVENVTELTDTTFVAFDHRDTFEVLYQLGSEQDETERLPGPQVINRLFGVKVANFLRRTEKNMHKVGF